ncbi:hypothetical protein KR067_002205, partial [Drosophila pandora]
VGRPSMLIIILIFRSRIKVHITGRQQCWGRSHIGFNINKSCNKYYMENMWYYDTKVKFCRTMEYLGCGGNNNRYCSRDHCRIKCDPS